MSRARRLLGLYSAGGCVIVLLLGVLVNLVSTRYFVRVDFTENRIYSLSPSTVGLLNRLTDPLRMKVFFDENLPPEFSHHRRYLKELLEEMSSAAGGRLRVEFADMKKPESREDAMRAGVAPLRFTAVRQDKFEVQEGMMGLAMYYEDRKEVIPSVTQSGNIEYEIASRIVKLTRKAKPVVGWTAVAGELDPPGSLQEYLSQNFEMRRIEDIGKSGWGPGGPAAAGLSALIVAGPRTPLTDTTQQAMDAAIIAGIPTAVLVDPYDINTQHFFARRNETGIERILRAYGLGIREGLIVDAQNIPVQISSQQGFFMMQTLVNYPYIPRVTDLSRDHAVTRTLQEIALPFVSAIDVMDSSGVTVLARTSPQSYRMTNPMFVNPTQEIQIEGAEPGPYIVGASVQGIRRSAFADTLPAGRPATGNVRLVVMANAGFLDEGRGAGPANVAFIQNMIDWLAASEDLISIRSKFNTFRPLSRLTDAKRNMIKAANIFLMPLVFAVFGLVRWQLRRRRRRMDETAASTPASA